MSEKRVSLTIEGVPVSVPEGTLIVDAAKQAGIDIPVFCYHPKLEPVGMCRMCLVEIGRPARDPATGQPARDPEGRPVIQFGPKLETACTTPVGEGWVVRGASDPAREGRRAILEFLLTSHPLDCPICDKGGECPLQNLTMAYGPGTSRFAVEDKQHLAKRVPLGELIVLDRERCIQCGRCVRFQDEIVGEPVLGFSERGRHLEIVTFSQPGFDSVFSGNTTDICPVGALTTTDFRFEARAWEMNAAASICTHCPVGCNLTLNTRRQPQAGGRMLVQRVMPRQHESVNEIWICDKGRMAHHFAASPERLARPRLRVDGDLIEVTWERALEAAAEGLQAAGGRLLGLAGGRAANEDLFLLKRLAEARGGRTLLDEGMAGGDRAAAVGAARGTDIGRLGAGDAALVIACDLQEEAPIWWLRLKQAADRGAAVVVAQARPTTSDRFAAHRLRHAPGRAVQAALGFLAGAGEPGLERYAGEDDPAAAAALAGANRLLVFFGREGLDGAGSEALARALASLLVRSGHAGREGSGLIPVWPRANTQGAWDVGLRPAPHGAGQALGDAAALIVMAADPVGDDPRVDAALGQGRFVVVQDLFLTPTAARADVVFPAQAFTEREGTYTSGERRVQRFYPAVPPFGESRPDWQILAALAGRLGVDLHAGSAAEVFQAIADSVPDYRGLSYQALGRVEPQWPIVGGDDLYYGGTAYRNEQGLGVQIGCAAERGALASPGWAPPPETPVPSGDELLLIPVTRLYDRGRTLLDSHVLAPRLPAAQIELNPDDARRLGLEEGAQVELRWPEGQARVQARVRPDVPAGCALVPRSQGVPLEHPAPAAVRAAG